MQLPFPWKKSGFESRSRLKEEWAHCRLTCKIAQLVERFHFRNMLSVQFRFLQPKACYTFTLLLFYMGDKLKRNDFHPFTFSWVLEILQASGEQPEDYWFKSNILHIWFVAPNKSHIVLWIFEFWRSGLPDGAYKHCKCLTIQCDGHIAHHT